MSEKTIKTIHKRNILVEIPHLPYFKKFVISVAICVFTDGTFFITQNFKLQKKLSEFIKHGTTL